MGLNIRDQQRADVFIRGVVEKFKVQRMGSSPETSVLLVTIVSEMPASYFVKRWKQIAADDKVLGFFMSRMGKADVLRGTVAGQTLETASLLHELWVQPNYETRFLVLRLSDFKLAWISRKAV